MLARQLFKLIAGIAVPLLPVACSSVPPTPVSTLLPAATPTTTSLPISVVQFLPFQNSWGEWQAKDTGFSLAIGIYAQSKDVAFLLGNLRVPAGASRSTLLRSKDGGQSWVEVMEPVSGSSVIEIEMTTEGIGWALVMWTVEGPGSITLISHI